MTKDEITQKYADKGKSHIIALTISITMARLFIMLMTQISQIKQKL